MQAQACNITSLHPSDAALDAQAEAIVLPATRDLYFPPEDQIYEVSFMPHAELRVIPGVWGHFAGGGQNVDDTIFVDRAVRDLLARPSRYQTVPGI